VFPNDTKTEDKPNSEWLQNIVNASQKQSKQNKKQRTNKNTANKKQTKQNKTTNRKTIPKTKQK
jgi:hypothetical protein